MPTMLTELGQQELCEWQDSGGTDQRLMGTRAPQRWNTECISGSSLPFCRRRDRPRWGKRLIEGLACIRMWLLIEVWGECHSLRLYLPPPSVSQPPSSTKHLSPACSTLTLFLDEHWYPPPPYHHHQLHLHHSAASQCFFSLSLLATCSLRQCVLSCPPIPAGRHTHRSSSCPTSPLLQLSWRAKPLSVKPQGEGEREGTVAEEGWKGSFYLVEVFPAIYQASKHNRQTSSHDVVWWYDLKKKTHTNTHIAAFWEQIKGVSAYS